MTLATGGTTTDIEISGTNYRVHSFTLPVRATFNSGVAKLQADTNTVGTRTIVANDVVYVSNSSEAGQIGNTYVASGSTDNWTWTLYGLTVTAAGDVDVLVVAGGGGGGNAPVSGEGGGGGGAGGSVYQAAANMAVGSYPARVGIGGLYNENGSSSVFDGRTA
jgi:hypothetical protein